MSSLKAPADVKFTSGESVVNHFKSFTNYFSCQCQLHADKVYVRYPSEPGTWKTLTYADVDHISTNLACKWAKDTGNAEIVSLLASPNVNYVIVMLAVLKLRITLFALSHRNSESAVAALLEKTNTRVLITDAKLESLAKKATAEIQDIKLITYDPFDLEALKEEPIHSDCKNILNTDFSSKDIEKSVLVFHSSGSTAFPRPIYLSNRYLFHAVDLYEVNGDYDILSSNDVALFSAPLYHILGFFAHMSVVAFGGSLAYTEKFPPSPRDMEATIKANNATIMNGPPLLMEQMIPHFESNSDYSAFKDMKLITYGGAPLKEESLEKFSSHGITIRPGYGATEFGITMGSDPNIAKNGNRGLRPLRNTEDGESYLVFEENDAADPSIKHLYIRAGCPCLANNVSNRNDGGYNSNDLFVESSKFPGYYTCIGRRDDIIIMENGEKTNPVPMEGTLCDSPMIKKAIVVGQKRQCTAALIQLDKDYSKDFDPKEIMDAIQESVKKANIDCLNHSKILPQMVKILPLSKTLPSTNKGNVIRKKAESMYADTIEKLYKDLFESGSRKKKSNTDGSDASSWTSEQIKDFLATCVADTLDTEKSTIEDYSQSVFDLGINSLSAIQLRNFIAEHFDVSQNFVFQHSTIDAMCEALTSDQKEDSDTQIENRYQQTQELARDYINKAKGDFPVASNDYDKSSDEIVLLTGATGSLGSFILRDLLKNTTIKKVYCCVRGKDSQLFSRIEESFAARSLDQSLLENDRVEALPMRFNDPFLGFGENRYKQLKEEVTIVQHCAWMLDFNMPVDHYDKECIAPFYNLLKFAYKEVNPMHVHFISSVSASAGAANSDGEISEEALPLDAHVAMPMGYAHSKFIVEVLFNYLSSKVNFPCYIERIGQVCGDSINGVWNTSEQYPLTFVGGGSIMHKMPALDTAIDWIPVDYAAASIADIMIRTAHLPASEKMSVYHIVNPCSIAWSDVLEAMEESGMKFDTVEPTKWAEYLAKDDKNPAFRLISFYETAFKKPVNMPKWQTKRTSEMTPIISKSPILDTQLFKKFLQYWESVGFYNPSI